MVSGKWDWQGGGGGDPSIEPERATVMSLLF